MAIILDQRVRIAIVAVVVLSCGVSLAEEPRKAKAESDGFVRLQRTEDGQPVALETSVVSYGPKGDGETRLRVDLIGAIHVGDKAYYDKLNKAFRRYDVVLYELVAKKDEVPRPGQRSAHPISAMQVGMKNMLGLEFQLDHIKYGKKNMVHADLTPTEFSKSMEDRGESMTQMFLRMMGQSIAEQSKDPSGSGDFRTTNTPPICANCTTVNTIPITRPRMDSGTDICRPEKVEICHTWAARPEANSTARM